MTNDNNSNEPNTLPRDFFLRIKNQSELGRMLEAMNESGELTDIQLQGIGGQKRSPWFLRAMGVNSDNLQVTMKRNKAGQQVHTFNYVDVVGRNQTVVNVDSASFAGGAGTGVGQEAAKPVSADDHKVMQWPNAPRLLDTSDYPWFRKPGWHNTMETMVEAGAHISLAGPPSVGKDTGVEYMAAEKGRPLVVVNGSGGLRVRNILGTSQMVSGTSYIKVAEAAAAMVNGWWLMITEVNAADPDVLLLLNGVLAPPHMISIEGKQYPVHKDFRLFISYNPGLIGTKPLPQSFKDRFFPIQVDFLSETELRKRLEAHGMPALEGDNEVLVNGMPMEKLDWPEKVVKFGRSMWDSHKAGKFHYQISVRRLIDAVKLMNMDTTNGDCKKALQMAVLNTIDSPIEQREAKRVLDEIFQNNANRW